jgi:hypothetical protein
MLFILRLQNLLQQVNMLLLLILQLPLTRLEVSCSHVFESRVERALHCLRVLCHALSMLMLKHGCLLA